MGTSFNSLPFTWKDNHSPPPLLLLSRIVPKLLLHQEKQSFVLLPFNVPNPVQEQFLPKLCDIFQEFFSVRLIIHFLSLCSRSNKNKI